MPGLVPGIQPTACSGTRAALDPGNKCRDDMEPSIGAMALGRLAGEDAGGLPEQGLALDHVVGAVEHRLQGAAVDLLGERVLGGGPVVQLVGGLLADALALGRGEEA